MNFCLIGIVFLFATFVIVLNETSENPRTSMVTTPVSSITKPLSSENEKKFLAQMVSEVCIYNFTCGTMSAHNKAIPAVGCRCLCDDACRYRSDCCLDAPNFGVMEKAESSSCRSSGVLSATDGGEQSLNFPSYKVIADCKGRDWNPIQTIMCKFSYMYEYRWAVDKTQGTIYKNKYCAFCNGVAVESILEWEVVTTASCMMERLLSEHAKIEIEANSIFNNGEADYMAGGQNFYPSFSDNFVPDFPPNKLGAEDQLVSTTMDPLQPFTNWLSRTDPLMDERKLLNPWYKSPGKNDSWELRIALTTAMEGGCTIFTKPPPNIDAFVHDFRCVLDSKTSVKRSFVNRCKDTSGLESIYHLEKACDTFWSAVASRVDSSLIYKNPFCYVCNMESGDIEASVAPSPEESFVNLVQETLSMEGLAVHLSSLYIESPGPHSQSGECKNDEIYLEELGRCLHVFCPLPNLYKNGTCIPMENTRFSFTIFVNPRVGIAERTPPDDMLMRSVEASVCLSQDFLSHTPCNLSIGDVFLVEEMWRFEIYIWHSGVCNTRVASRILSRVLASWHFYCELFGNSVTLSSTTPIYDRPMPLLKNTEDSKDNVIHPHHHDCRFVLVTKEEMKSVPNLAKYGVLNETVDPLLDQFKKTATEELVVLCLFSNERSLDLSTNATLTEQSNDGPTPTQIVSKNTTTGPTMAKDYGGVEHVELRPNSSFSSTSGNGVNTMKFVLILLVSCIFWCEVNYMD